MTAITRARLRGAAPGANLAEIDVDDTTDEWIDVAVPGDVRAALVAADRLTDPDRDATDAESDWVDDLEWWYRFPLPASDGDSVLRFDGIDTFATVFVDGVEAARSHNMFRTVEVPLEPGAHVVAVRIARPWAALGLSSTHDFDDRRLGPRTRVRKAQFGYGWDFAPNQPSLGLWRPVTMVHRGTAWIDSVRFQTLRLDGGVATVSIDVFVGGAGETAAITLTAPSGEVVFAGDVAVVDGVARAVAVVHDAVLWWPHTHGHPNRYALRVEVGPETHTSSVGIRTIALDQSANPDDLGRRFFRFVVNGVPVFVKGANWVPADMAVGCVGEGDYRRVLEPARDAHMNMVRVWGGGVYEHDAFYDVCDELGLLVWQEFMFACAPYHDDEQAWLDDIRAEATDQVRRLRSHPCVALWCGNNEVEAIAMLRDPDLQHSEGAGIFYEVLPQVVAAEDGVTGYVPSSPMLGNGPEDADRHNWDVWHGLAARAKAGIGFDEFAAIWADGVVVDVDSEAGQTFARGMSADQYLQDTTRLPSEFGLRSLPARPTLAQWIDDANLDIADEQITARNRDTGGPSNKVELASSRVIGTPCTLDELIDFSQFTQAEGLKLGCEHFRRRWPTCGGALIWQLNDCWPAPTWSLVDHAGRAKAALAYAARFYAPVLASFTLDEHGGASLWISNDTADVFADALSVRLHSLDGTDVWARTVDVRVAPLTSVVAASWNADELDGGPDRALLVASPAGRVPENRQFFVAPKDLERGDVSVTARFEQLADGRVAITLSAHGYALMVHALVDDPTVRFDDNYFDLPSGATRTITSRAPASPDQITIRWL